MDKTGKGILAIATLSIIVSLGVSFMHFYVERDFLVYANISCDPATEYCYLGDGEYAPEYYKVIARPAHTIPSCNGWGNECEPLSCSDGHELCEELTCDPESEECSSPIL